MAKQVLIRIRAAAEHEECITMALFEQGAEAVSVEDPMTIKKHLQNGDWDASVFDGQDVETGFVTVSAVAEAVSVESMLADLQTFLLGQDITAEVQSEPLPDVDWQQQWKEAFQPIPIGEKLLIVPHWMKDVHIEGRIPIYVNPGSAFGTGDHPTTSMILAMLEENLHTGDRVMDFGCGSGILGIAALKLGASQVTGVDIDESCAASVAEHMTLNGVSDDEFRFIAGDVVGEDKLHRTLRRDKAQIVLANINTDTNILLSRVAYRFMAPGARFICSGVIAERGGEMAAALVGNGMAILKMQEQGEWAAFVTVASYE